jgi:hypothetical protein
LKLCRVQQQLASATDADCDQFFADGGGDDDDQHAADADADAADYDGVAIDIDDGDSVHETTDA